MKTTLSLIPVVLIVLSAGALHLNAQAGFPRMSSVDPVNAKSGDVLTVKGENLDKANVAKFYLTDGKNDVTLEVAEQAATTVKVKVPASIKPGRFSLMVLTTGKTPKLIEQPVKVTIE